MDLEQTSIQPSTDGLSGPGRDTSGKFTTGNKVGRGNPHAKHVAQLRSAMLAAVSVEDMQEVVATLVALAKTGDVPAIREVFLRTLGRPTEPDMIERLERVEELLQARENDDAR